jgi:hypothetical protein
MLDEIKKRCIISNNYNTKAYCVKFNFYVLQTCSSGVEKKNIDSKRQYSFQILHSIGQTNLLRGALEAAPPREEVQSTRWETSRVLQECIRRRPKALYRVLCADVQKAARPLPPGAKDLTGCLWLFREARGNRTPAPSAQ